MQDLIQQIKNRLQLAYCKTCKIPLSLNRCHMQIITDKGIDQILLIKQLSNKIEYRGET